MKWAAGSGARVEVVAPAVVRTEPDFPRPLSHLKITGESFCGPATFSLLFIHVLKAQFLLVQYLILCPLPKIML